MAFPYRRILSPIEFDETSYAALDAAARVATENDGAVLLLHVVPMVVLPTGMPNYVDVYKEQEKVALDKLKEIAERCLAGIKHEILTRVGEPAQAILSAERQLAADLIVLATHGRTGVKRMLLGSVAETVLREATCPVLTVRCCEADVHTVAKWMTPRPMTAEPSEKLSTVRTKMLAGRFRSVPILSEGKLVGIVTDRDLRRHEGYLENTDVTLAMTEEVATVTPITPVHAAAKTLLERKIGALPVMENGRLVGIISTSDILHAFLDTN